MAAFNWILILDIVALAATLRDAGLGLAGA
jgi:hypothetical protein